MTYQGLIAPVFAVERHRIATDGAGVTTLVAFHGCPLRCRYCANKQCNVPDTPVRYFTPIELLNATMVDNLYFLATGGGITFGGGEPMSRSAFIEKFCRLAPPEWTINIETSLNVDRAHVERLSPYIDKYIVDVKDMNADIYRRYTGRDPSLMLSNLEWLMSHEGMADRVMVCLPLIPGYNDDGDRRRSVERLRAIGVKHIDKFDYMTDFD